MEEENKNESIFEQPEKENESAMQSVEEVFQDSVEVQAEFLNVVEQVEKESSSDIQERQQNTVVDSKKQENTDIDLVSVSPVEFVSFDDSEKRLSDDPKANLDIMQDVKMHITVELGRAKSSVKKILDLSKGSIVELNKVAGEQVELYANGRFIAYGEVIVIEDKFGLRVTNVSHQNIHNL